MDLQPYLQFAQSFTQRSRQLVLELWHRRNLEIELKEDRSPVTNLDRAIELEFRETLSAHFPDHGVLGEEFGLSGSQSEFMWVIDPIDGTQSLINEVPTFGMFLSLLFNSEAVLGVIDIPVLNYSVSGARGLGVTDERGKRVKFDSTPFGPNDIVALGTSGSFAKGGQQELQSRLQREFPTCRAYYDCFGHYLAATGRAGGLVEFNVPLWDVVATEALISAAGGEVFIVKNSSDPLSLRSSISGRREVVEEIRKVLEL